MFVSPRMLCEAWQRARASGWKDPTDRSAPGGYLRIKTNQGYYTPVWFRYDLPLTANFYEGVHPEDLKKVRPQQLPVGRPRRTS